MATLFKAHPVRFVISALFCITAFASIAYAATETGTHHDFSLTFLAIALMLLAAKVGGLVERIRQPAVLGELLMGIFLGNLALVGISFFEPIKNDQFINFLAELGVVILLFQIGLESDITRMRKVGSRSFLVACVGVVVPFALGTYVIGPWLLLGLSSHAYLFLGAALTATSVSIPARMFKDLGRLQTPEAQTILGAAVIDDVLGLIILAVVSAIATAGSVGLGVIAIITAKALIFLTGAIFLGQLIAPRVSKWFSKIHTGEGMKFTIALVFGLITSYLAGYIGLAPIVGAFAAGLVLDPVHFRYFRKPAFVQDITDKLKHLKEVDRLEVENALEHHAHRHVEDLIAPVGHMLVPLFFVYTGMKTDLATLLHPGLLLVAIGITAVAFLSKYASGFVAGRVNKHIVGVGMAPRGEVGLIFATTGLAVGVIDEGTFSIIVAVVVLTTLVTPPILGMLLRRSA